MPRFYFNVRDGKDILDDEGMLFTNYQHALKHGICLAGHIIADEAKDFVSGKDWRLELCDENGLIIFVLDFHVTKSPAIGL